MAPCREARIVVVTIVTGVLLRNLNVRMAAVSRNVVAWVQSLT